MNYMYNMSIDFHNYVVILLLVLIGLNFVLLFRAKNVFSYRKKMAYLTPTIAVLLASILFTGTIMMAAKHLDFTLANIAMIAIAIAFIVLEAKRVKPIKRLKDVPEAIPVYRDFAKKILSIELLIVLVISIWMWI
ncbi:hypothetical protein [Sulfurimonas sp. HSL3-2]|uniref:hypothetical protein n=1 Tax=Hydrocurvibacter mobilis TaxID=3131936 RepID=UPI0031F982E1